MKLVKELKYKVKNLCKRILNFIYSLFIWKGKYKMNEISYNYSKTNSLVRSFHPIINGKINYNINVTDVPMSEITNFSVDMCTQPKLAPEKMLKLYPTTPTILCNASFFVTSTGDSIWTLKSNNTVYSYDANMAVGFGVPTKDKLPFEGTYKPNSDYIQNDYSWRDFVTAYPNLYFNGQRCNITMGSEINYNAHRTVIGWTKGRNVLFIITFEGKGVNFSRLQDYIKQIYPDVWYCCNLDGGGSVAHYFDGKRISDPGWERPIDSVISIFVRTDQERQEKEEAMKPNIRYTVQLGAWSKKEYADAYLKKVQLLRTEVHDYKDAYVKFIDNRYKIQCGVFSKKENAERLVEDLKKNGYDCYITVKK